MAWCSVKAQGQLYLLPLPIPLLFLHLTLVFRIIPSFQDFPPKFVYISHVYHERYISAHLILLDLTTLIILGETYKFEAPH
jgi:hypothetical protein